MMGILLLHLLYEQVIDCIMEISIVPAGCLLKC